jgi:hypothetical protein
MSENQDKVIVQVFDAANKLIALADDGDANSCDDGCHVLFGVVRDCAYKILTEARREMDIHRLRYPREKNNNCMRGLDRA